MYFITCMAAWRAAAAATADELDEEDESWTFETGGPNWAFAIIIILSHLQFE